MPPPLETLVDRWRPRHFPPLPGRWVVAAGLRAFAVAGLTRKVDGPILVIVPSERDADDLADDLSLFIDDVHLMPAWEILPFEHISPNASTMARRSEARHRLLTGSKGTVVVASVRAAIQRTSPSDPSPILLSKGDEIEVTALARQLADLGYQRTDRVEARGEFAVRGGIVDVYPAQGHEPVRIDFWGDVIDDLRSFSPGDQRSSDVVDRLVAYPAREFRPDGEHIIERATELLATDPWNASVWDRLIERQHFSGMESWMPWLSEERCLLDEIGGRSVCGGRRAWARGLPCG